MDATGHVWTYRPRTSGWWLAAAWLLVVTWYVSDVVTRGAAGVLAGLPGAVLAAVVAYAVFWAPRVDVDADGVHVVNPLRTVRVPWVALIDVRTRYAFTVVTPHGSVRAWAAPGPGRHDLSRAGGQDLAGLPRAAFDGRRSVAASDLPTSPAGVVSAVVRRRWSDMVEAGEIPAGEADAATTSTTWHVRTMAVVLVASVVALVAAAR